MATSRDSAEQPCLQQEAEEKKEKKEEEEEEEEEEKKEKKEKKEEEEEEEYGQDGHHRKSEQMPVLKELTHDNKEQRKGIVHHDNQEGRKDITHQLTAFLKQYHQKERFIVRKLLSIGST